MKHLNKEENDWLIYGFPIRPIIAVNFYTRFNCYTAHTLLPFYCLYNKDFTDTIFMPSCTNKNFEVNSRLYKIWAYFTLISYSYYTGLYIITRAVHVSASQHYRAIFTILFLNFISIILSIIQQYCLCGCKPLISQSADNIHAITWFVYANLYVH